MALATTCPSCKTSFKVNPEQLKLRKGLVRCGKCRHVFSGIQYLRYVSDKRRSKPKPTRPDPQADPIAPQTVAEDLNTAFFLPDTVFAPDAVANASATATLKVPRATAQAIAAGKLPGSSTANPLATAPASPTVTADPVTHGPDALTSGNGGSRKSRRANRRKNRRRRNRANAAQANAGAQALGPDSVATTTNGQATANVQANADDRGQAELARQSESTDGLGDTSSTSVASASHDAPDTPRAESRQAIASAPQTSDGATDSNGAAHALARHDSDAATSQTRSETVGADEQPLRHKLRSHGPTDPKEAAEQPDQTTAAAAAGAAQIGAEPNTNDTEQTVSDGADVTQGVSAPPGKSTSAQPAARSGTSKEPEHISARATDGNPWPDGIDDSGDSAISDDEEDAIDFFGQSSKPAFDFDLPPRGVWIAAGALTVLLALQLAIGARDSLAALFPAAKPVLQTVSESLGLTVNLPLRADAIRIESHDLASASAPGTRGDKSNYVLNLLIRNHADTTLRWPAIELTLTDRTGANILIRKALMPADYLADASRADSGMPARSEKSLRLNLRVRNNLPMHGYTAVLFYP